MDECMDGCIDAWMNAWMNAWMDECMDGCMDVDGWMWSACMMDGPYRAYEYLYVNMCA
jgi:hypothetical protein